MPSSRIGQELAKFMCSICHGAKYIKQAWFIKRILKNGRNRSEVAVFRWLNGRPSIPKPKALLCLPARPLECRH
jgi:hypothetical protein